MSMKTISKENMAALWTVEKEQAGIPALVGCVVRIEIQQINPMLRRAVIAPVNRSETEQAFGNIFGRIKPAIAHIEGDMLLCSLGILARRNK